MADTTDWNDDISGEDETDDSIIELTDIVKESSDHTTQEDVIELTGIVEEGSADLNLDIVKEENDELEGDFELEDETSFNEEFEFEIDEPMDEPMEDSSLEHEQEIVSPQDLTLSSEQLEAALERVIEKKFGDKIETLMFEVMEKVIEKEIAEIKERLTKDLDPAGNV